MGFPLVCVPQVLGYGHAHVHAHVLGHALCDEVLGALAFALAQTEKTQRRCLGRRRSLEAQSGALGKS